MGSPVRISPASLRMYRSRVTFSRASFFTPMMVLNSLAVGRPSLIFIHASDPCSMSENTSIFWRDMAVAPRRSEGSAALVEGALDPSVDCHIADLEEISRGVGARKFVAPHSPDERGRPVTGLIDSGRPPNVARLVILGRVNSV